MMNAGILFFVIAASLTPAEQKAISRDVPLPERRLAFERLIHKYPGDVSLYGEFASLLVASQDFQTALPWIDKGLKLAPGDAVLNLRKGEALVALGQGQDALGSLQKVPLTGESQFFRGLAEQMAGDHRASRDCFLDSWQRGNEDAYVLYSLIREDRELGDKASGLEHFKTMLARFPDSAWMHTLLGDAHLQKSEEAEARKEYLAAVGVMPDLFEPNFRLAFLAFQAGEYGSAVDYYRRAVAAKPHDSESNVYLGEALRREGKLDEAVVQLRRAIQLDEDSVLAYDSLGKSLVDLSRLSEAADLLGRAEKLFPEESAFPAMRARVFSRLGKTEDAKLCAQRAADIIAAKNKKVSLVGPQ